MANIKIKASRALTHPDGTASNPFRDLYELKMAVERGDVTSAGNYYFDIDGTVTALTLVETGDVFSDSFVTTSRTDEGIAVPRFVIKVTSDWVTLHRHSEVTSATLDSNGVLEMSNIFNYGCGQNMGSWAYVLPENITVNYALCEIYRPNSIWQCFALKSVNHDYSVTNGVFGGAYGDSFGVNQPNYYLAGSDTSADYLDVNRHVYGHEEYKNEHDATYSASDSRWSPGMCAWRTGVYAFRTTDGTDTGSQGNASTNGYNYPWIKCAVQLEPTNVVGVGFNCDTDETSEDQTASGPGGAQSTMEIYVGLG